MVWFFGVSLLGSFSGLCGSPFFGRASLVCYSVLHVWFDRLGRVVFLVGLVTWSVVIGLVGCCVFFWVCLDWSVRLGCVLGWFGSLLGGGRFG